MSERKQTFKNSANNFNTTCKSIFPGAASDLLLTRSFTNSEQSKCSSLKWKASNNEIFTLLLIYGVSFLGLNGLNIIFKGRMNNVYEIFKARVNFIFFQKWWRFHHNRLFGTRGYQNFCRMTQEGFTVGLIRVGDNVKKYKLIDFRGRDEVKKDINSK